MTVLTATHPTIVDVAKRLDPGGKIDTIAELLNQRNEVLNDAVWIEANETTSHVSTVRTGLPSVTWRKIYGFVQPSKSTTVQVRDNTGMLEAYAEVDKALADLNGNTAAFRFSEELSFIEAMNEEQADTIFYGNEGTEPEAFTGLTPRYNSLAAANGQNIINAAGDSDRTSVWLVGWGPNTVHCIYPKGSKAGLQTTDKGVVTIESLGNSVASAGRMEAYRTHYRWDSGLVLRDWRYVVRIANIDQAALTKNAATGADLIDLMTRSLDTIESTNGVRPAFYMNRTLLSVLRRQIVNKVAGSTLSVDMVAGKQVVSFAGIPVRRVDRLVSGESAVS